MTKKTEKAIVTMTPEPDSVVSKATEPEPVTLESLTQRLAEMRVAVDEFSQKLSADEAHLEGLLRLAEAEDKAAAASLGDYRKHLNDGETEKGDAALVQVKAHRDMAAGLRERVGVFMVTDLAARRETLRLAVVALVSPLQPIEAQVQKSRQDLSLMLTIVENQLACLRKIADLVAKAKDVGK